MRPGFITMNLSRTQKEHRKNAVRKLQERSKKLVKNAAADFYKVGIVSLVHRWTGEIEKRGDYIKK